MAAQQSAGGVRHEHATLAQNQFLFWMCFISLVTTAFSFASRAQVITFIGDEFNLTETFKGWLLGAGMWPFAIGIVGFSLIVDKIGYKASLFFAWFCHVVSTFMIVFGPNFWWLFFGTLLVAVGNGTVEAVINPAVATLFTKNKTKWLNILHAGWAGGIMLGSLVALFLGHIGWRWKIGIILVPAVIYGIMLLKAKFPVSERVMAGVSYRDMLKEMGIMGFTVIVYLVSKELMNIVANLGWAFNGWSEPKMLAFALIPTIIVMVPLGAYIKGAGRGLFLVLMLLMFPLATTELATDAWIKDLMSPVFEKNFHIDGGWMLVYSSCVMMILRFNAGKLIGRIGPVGLMIVSSFAAAIGLAFIGNTQGVWLVVAATVYAVGQTFFWPTMLGIVGDRFPKGGALTLNSVSAAGMLGVGILGTPLMGLLQDTNINSKLREKDTAAYEQVVTAEKRSIYGTYKALDPATVDALEASVPAKEKQIELLFAKLQANQAAIEAANAEIAAMKKPSSEALQKLETLRQANAATIMSVEKMKTHVGAAKERLTLIAAIRADAKRYAITAVAIVPFIMGICYILLMLWFRSTGGYKVVELKTEGSA